MLYADFVAAMDSTMTVLGFDHPNYTNPSDREWSIDELATIYWDDIERRQPGDVRFIVAGHSFGGVVAHHLSIKMQHRGRVVSCLAMFDSPWPSSTLPTEPDVAQFLLNSYGIKPSSSLVLKSENSSLLSSMDFVAAVGQECRGLHLGDWEVMSRVYYANVHALRNHSIDHNVTLAFPVVYVRAVGKDVLGDAVAMWTREIPGLEVKDVEATHSSLCTGSRAAIVASIIDKVIN